MHRRLSQCVGLAGLLLLLCYGVIASPLGGSAATSATEEHRRDRLPAREGGSAPRKLHGRFLHITDLHPDDSYKVHSSTKEDDACHRGHGPAGFYGAETSDCDTPISLVNATLDWLAEHVKDRVDFVIWTGDSARHDSDEKMPRSASEVIGSNKRLSEQFVRLFSEDGDGKRMSVPVVPTFGNNDILPHNILMPGPNKWLQTYTDVWRRFIPEEQRHSFEFGGWFYVEVIPNKLAVFSLNTLYFFDRNAGVDDCVQPSQPGYKQMEWLRIQLKFMRDRGMKAILMGHVPPARTESKQLWDETCWQKYTLWLQQYRDVVVGALYGHMNVDHFLLQDTKQINVAWLMGQSNADLAIRDAMDDELSIESTADYLQELRDGWSKLPPPKDLGEDGESSSGKKKGKKKKKKKKKKNRHGAWAERYQLSFISPSIVPNYFPTIRLVEYNISGIEDTPVWSDVSAKSASAPATGEESQHRIELRGDAWFKSLETDSGSGEVSNSASGKRKPKKGKDKKPKDPNLVVPEPPAKSSPPGPAYSPQPLTFTGYVQYYANLTHINNDTTAGDKAVTEGTTATKDDESWAGWLRRWRQGKDRSKEPKAKNPSPNKFKFEVEYSTFEDKIYGLKDLTVKSFVELAYRMGQSGAEGKPFPEGSELEDEKDVPSDDEEDSDSDHDFEAVGRKDKKKDKKKKKKKKKGKGKGKGKKDKSGKDNKTWVHFLKHAFVSTVDKKGLKKMA